jgi:hypothetical protein
MKYFRFTIAQFMVLIALLALLLFPLYWVSIERQRAVAMEREAALRAHELAARAALEAQKFSRADRDRAAQPAGSEDDKAALITQLRRENSELRKELDELRARLNRSH